MLRICAAILASCPLFAQHSDTAFVRLKQRFDYDRAAPLEVQESSVQERSGVKLHDITYRSPVGGRVPAWLVVPDGKGPFAGILFGHWMMLGSPLKNRDEFLEEAVLLARAGAVSILIDTPLVRPGVVEDKDPLSPQVSSATRQQVIDLRRALDLLLAREDVDRKRIAYVGHSFDADVGAILAASTSGSRHSC